MVPRSAEVFDPGLISAIRNRATSVEETAFIDNSAPVGYELDLGFVDVDAADREKPHPHRSGQRCVGPQQGSFMALALPGRHPYGTSDAGICSIAVQIVATTCSTGSPRSRPLERTVPVVSMSGRHGGSR